MSSSPTSALIDVTMPQMGVSVAEGTVVEWHKQIGDHVDADETIVEISTDKIDTEVPAPVSGTVAEILVAPEQTVEVGVVLARIAVDGAVPTEHEPPAQAPPAPDNAAPAAPRTRTPAPPTNGAIHPRVARYTPVVARIAAEHGIDLSRVTGTGRAGRVTKQDVLAYLGDSPQTEPPLHIESPYRPEPVAAAPGAERLSRTRRTIGEHMRRSLDTAAHCTTWMEVDMGRVEAAREQLSVTALPFVARATVQALRQQPALNAWLEGEKYTRHHVVHLGIAVSLGEEGLIVPVVRDAHELSVEGLASRIKELATQARAGTLSPDDVKGATFTITNPGQYGSIMATPIINQPQVAILDLEAIVKRPVVVTGPDGQDSIAIRPITILGMSWDHRALDGALAAQFLATIRKILEGWGAA